MKSLLGVLMCLVLITSQSFAVSGGPDFSDDATAVNTVGTYAGVLHAKRFEPDTGQRPNSIGLFTLSIPQTGLANGTALMFEQGQVYTGDIQGLADPDRAKLIAIISATFPYITTVPTGEVDDNGNPVYETVTVSATASGRVKAQISQSAVLTSLAGTRIKGKADIQYSLTVNNPFSEIIYRVTGFKQSSD